jgi:hypothetical protein
MALNDLAVTPPGGPVRDRASRVRRLVAAWSAPACYLVLACLAYWPISPLDSHHLITWSPDPQQQTWYLAWPPFALTHGLNPFFTTYLQAPKGGNLAASTSMPLLGLLGSPVTLLAGPLATFNLMLRLALAASGTSMFFVLRRYTSWWPAAFGGGLLFEFSAYMVGQGHKHIFLVFVPLVLLLIPLLDDWLVSLRRTPLGSGILVGLAMGLQYLISPEIFLAAAVFATAGLLFLAARHPAAAWQRLGVLARGLAASVPVFLLVAGYAIWMFLAGPGHPTGSPHNLRDLITYHGDVLSAIVPTSNQLFAPHVLSRIGNTTVRTSTVENGLYLGVPLLVLLCYLAVRFRRTGIVAVSAVVGVAAFVLSLGPKLAVYHKVLLHPMPFSVLLHLPVLRDLEAVRFSLFVQLAAAVILGVGLDRVRASGWRAGVADRALPGDRGALPGDRGALPGDRGALPGDRGALPGARGAEPGGDRHAVATQPITGPLAAEPLAVGSHAAEPPPAERQAAGLVRPLVVAAVGVAVLLPVVPRLPIHSALAAVPTFFTGRSVHVVPQGAVALTFPFDLRPNNDAMVWQAVSGMRFRILGGDVYVRLPAGVAPYQAKPPGGPVMSALLLAGTKRGGKPPPADQQTLTAIRQLCVHRHVEVILVRPTAPEGRAVAALISRALGAQPLVTGQLNIWLNVQRDLRRTP